MQEYHDHAKMIEGGFGYVCTCSAEVGEYHVMTECPCRSNEVEENLEKWNMMNDPNGFQPGDGPKFKTDMTLKIQH